MGTSTDGQICFGITFEDDFFFPWDAEEYDSDVEEWWKAVNGFVPIQGVWTEDGEKCEGVTSEVFDAYYDHRREWEKQNPIPLVEVNYCSGEYPMYILATPSSVITANSGYVEIISPQDLIVDEKEKQALLDFCTKYGIEHDEPQWSLSSYWG